MNRLIIIGNGFDLAHGLKTSFKDFMADYLADVYNTFHNERCYDDDLFKLIHYTDSEVKTNLVSSDNSILMFNRLIGVKDVRVDFKSEFIKNIIKKITSLNWVDIEVEYYQCLKLCKNGRFNVETLNAQFEFLKIRLFRYLKGQEVRFDERMLSNRLLDSLTSSIDSKEMIHDQEEYGELPNKFYVLNFNYTNICGKYISKLRKDFNISINYIHGRLDGAVGNPIFGFGDEFDDSYKEIENLNDNKYFEHIKSFEYSKNQNYYELIRFTELEDFQVQIYGHSCGISDRIMLNKIFENENCLSIKVFYYGDEKRNDFIDKLNNISRHFKDKTLLREKVVPLDMCTPMPQPIEEFKAKVNGQPS